MKKSVIALIILTISFFTYAEEIRVRLYGIDCPESSQDYGYQATQYTKSLALGKTVTVEKQDIDRYGRLVGIVYLPDGKILNELLVKNGYAWVYDKYCHLEICNYWKELENQAKNKHIGLWQNPNPIPPWEYRHMYKTSIIPTEEKFKALVTRVIDGDTIVVEKTGQEELPTETEDSSSGGCSLGKNNTFLLLIILTLTALLVRKIKLKTN